MDAPMFDDSEYFMPDSPDMVSTTSQSRLVTGLEASPVMGMTSDVWECQGIKWGRFEKPTNC